MPKMAAKKKKLADLKDRLGIKHACALSLLDHPDADERETLAEYVDINTYREAVDYLRQEQNDPRNQVFCEDCGWTGGMACPECAKGCGCEYECTGWRHAEARAATGDYDEDDDPYGCQECGAGGGGDPYGECVCYDDYDEDGQAA
ncbi:hypothetical protein QZH56_36865 (plasmid) [Streptomyces olivoreticuli]|uniref:hypothetical protein n=1 Tax=Streptomyces olivoreticuli TaxID=68246 RepID=UPI0026594D41|nr:hypothetical protein [Streptomyces olivoreticuli]WKK27826.1 hypothetical protein QZH56_36865 [Streptomyces olivoreticuli]